MGKKILCLRDRGPAQKVLSWFLAIRTQITLIPEVLLTQISAHFLELIVEGVDFQEKILENNRPGKHKCTIFLGNG